MPMKTGMQYGDTVSQAICPELGSITVAPIPFVSSSYLGQEDNGAMADLVGICGRLESYSVAYQYKLP